MGKKVQREYGDNTYTLAGFRSFIMSGLRDKSSRWSPKTMAKKRARDGKLINPKTGRENWANRCASCNDRFLEKTTVVDHVKPVIPVEGFKASRRNFLGYDFNEVIRRLFCEADGLQVLCKECHDIKSKKENEDRRKWK